MGRSAIRVGLAMLLGLACATAMAAPLAVVTIVDGQPVLVREATKLALAQGVRLNKDDIVETGQQDRLVRIEFSDGHILDLGPDTRALLAPKLPGARSKAPTAVYLLQGWAKWSAHKEAPAGGLLSAPLDVTGLGGRSVIAVLKDGTFVFAEQGEASVTERRAGKPQAPVLLKGNQFWARVGDDKASVAARPTPAFVQRVPRAFLDTLPARAELFKAKEVQPKRLSDIAYADVQGWLASEVALRPVFVTRWRAQANNPEFRKGLAAHMSAHPEWDRVLNPEKNPEKYAPKTGTTD